MKRSQLVKRGHRASPDLAGKGRVGQQAAANHHVAGLSVVAHQGLKVAHREDVAVVGHGEGRPPKG